MVEIVLVVTNFLIVLTVFVYFYLREVRHREDAQDQILQVSQFYRESSTAQENLFKEISLSKDKLVGQSFVAYLKHIQGLEKMVLPKPINKKMVEDIMLRTPPISENEIDKQDEEITEDNFMDVLSKIPITGATSVAFENEISAGEVPESVL